MMDTIAQRLLESVSWGLKMRLYTGAGLSTMDLISDVYMISYYATTGQPGTALSLAIMVGLCLLIQLLVVWFQNRKGPRRVMLKEMLIVLSGMKVRDFQSLLITLFVNNSLSLSYSHSPAGTP
jgi:hypothetical protein